MKSCRQSPCFSSSNCKVVVGGDIGHIHKRSNTSGGSGTASFPDVSFMGQSGFPKMHLIVDYPRNNETMAGIDYLSFLKQCFRSLSQDLGNLSPSMTRSA